jgi:hypothetical protein
VEDMTLLTDQVNEINYDVLLLKQLTANGSSQQSVSTSSASSGPMVQKIKVPEPILFSGARCDKELENFIWDIEQYFKAVHVPDEEKVSITTMYLKGDAKLWWRTRVSEICLGQPKIETWEHLKDELKKQFLPTNTSWLARESLRKLKHLGTICDYVKEFSTLLLDVTKMSEEDKLFNFMARLQPWAQT